MEWRAWNLINARARSFEVELAHTLTPSPALPRKRGREQTEFAVRADPTPHEDAVARSGAADPER